MSFSFTSGPTSLNSILAGGLPQVNVGVQFGQPPAFRTRQAGPPNTVGMIPKIVMLNPNATLINGLSPSFVFPLTPQSYSAKRQVLTNWYEAQGPIGATSTSSQLGQYGVTRITDMYGQTPYIINLKGTMGYNYYPTDNYTASGNEWTKNFQEFINGFFQALQFTGNPSPLFYTDLVHFVSRWVVPVGPVTITHDASRPLWQFYDLTLIDVGNDNNTFKEIYASLEAAFPSPSASSNAMSTFLSIGQGIVASLGPLKEFTGI